VLPVEQGRLAGLTVEGCSAAALRAAALRVPAGRVCGLLGCFLQQAHWALLAPVRLLLVRLAPARLLLVRRL